MNRKKVSIAVVSTAVVVLAVTCVTASHQTLNTPLYTFRIEQASSEMNFLPTAVSEFTYNTRDGYTVNWEFVSDDRVEGVFALNMRDEVYPRVACTHWNWRTCLTSRDVPCTFIMYTCMEPCTWENFGCQDDCMVN